MLVSLSIRDFVLIEKLDLTFARGSEAGLGALTGETGAGKSILIDALGLALGAAPTRLPSPPRSICPRAIRHMPSCPSRGSTMTTS